MADTFDRYDNEDQASGFMMGLLAGAVLGAGIGMLLAPKAGSELRGTIGTQARTFGNRASEQYRRASHTASEWAGKGREMVDKARESMQRRGEEGGYAGTTTGAGYGGTTTGSTYGGGTGTTYGGNTGTDYGRS